MRPFEAGLRVVTLLTTDAVSSTELQLRVGDHRSDLLRRERDGLVTREVEAARGQVVKSTGDGIFSAFLAPSEALTCAVAIQRAMARRNLVAHERIDLRIGLATGEVIVEGDDIFGQAAILCTRITDRAVPGEVLCDDTTRMLASARGDWQAEPVGDVPLKGFDRRTPLFRVEWAEVFEPLVPVPTPLVRPAAPFVGRPSDLATAHQLWAATASAERPHMLVLGGEPGVGKTTLLAQLAGTVNRSGATVLYGRCTEDDIDALRPVRQALTQYIAARPRHLDEELGAARRELVRLVPELEAEVGPPRAGEADHRAASAALLDAIAQWLRAASHVRPILFVIDDAERLDAQTAKLLRRLSEEPGLGPLLFAIAHRDRDPAAPAAELKALVSSLRSTDTTVEPLRLGPLGVDDVADLVAQVRPAAEPQAADLHRDSGGNPLYLLELLRSGDPEGAGLRQSEGRARGLVLRRVDQLPAGHVELLEAAAVLGQEFDVAAIEPMLDWPPDEAYKALDALVRAELLREVSPSGTRFEFAHGLVRSAVYDRLTGPAGSASTCGPPPRSRPWPTAVARSRPATSPTTTCAPPAPATSSPRSTGAARRPTTPTTAWRTRRRAGGSTPASSCSALCTCGPTPRCSTCSWPGPWPRSGRGSAARGAGSCTRPTRPGPSATPPACGGWRWPSTAGSSPCWARATASGSSCCARRWPCRRTSRPSGRACWPSWPRS